MKDAHQQGFKGCSLMWLQLQSHIVLKIFNVAVKINVLKILFTISAVASSCCIWVAFVFGCLSGWSSNLAFSFSFMIFVRNTVHPFECL